MRRSVSAAPEEVAISNESGTSVLIGARHPFDVHVVAEAALGRTNLDVRQRVDATCFFDLRALRAWAQAFLPGNGWRGPVSALCVRAADEEPRGFAAFATQSVAGVRIASLAGYYWPCRTLGLSGDDPDCLQVTDSIAEALSRRPLSPVLRMGPISSKDRAVASLVAGLLGRGWRAIKHESGGVFELKLPAGVGHLEESVSPSLLKNIAYLRRRLAKQHGEVRTVRHVLGADSAATLATLERIEARSWVAGGDAKFIGEANRRYWTTLGQSTGRACDVVFWTLYCGDHALAFSAHFETPLVVYIIANSFDDSWNAHSPGSILTLEVMRDAIARGKRSVDWGQGDSGYKGRWGAEASSTLFDVMLFKPGLVGSTLLAAARRRLRDWKSIDAVM